MNPALAAVIVYSLVVPQANASSARLVSGPGFEGAIMTAEALRSSEPHGQRSFTQLWTPTEAQVREAEALLPEYLASSAAAVVVRGSRIATELAQYRRQYWGVVRDGNRELLISFFHVKTSVGARGLWQTTVIAVQGGGDQYFRVSYGVESRRFSRLQVNAPE